MDYKVLKDVVIDGTRYAAGTTVTINHDKTGRLIMLGYLAEPSAEVETRAVGLKEETKPKKRTRSKARD